MRRRGIVQSTELDVAVGLNKREIVDVRTVWLGTRIVCPTQSRPGPEPT